MKNNQKGTSILAIIAMVAVLLLVGFVGYFVWDKNKSNKVDNATKTKETAMVTVTPTPAPTVVPTPTQAVVKVPEGYVLYENTNPKFSFIYPKEWDSHKGTGWVKGVKIYTKAVDEWIPYGWGSPSSYKYESNPGRWMRMDMNSKEQDIFAVKVLWRDDTKTVYDMSAGEGGGWQNQVAFIKDGKIYYIQAPAMGGCEAANGCYDDTKSVSIKSDDAVYQIAKSLTF